MQIVLWLGAAAVAAVRLWLPRASRAEVQAPPSLVAHGSSQVATDRGVAARQAAIGRDVHGDVNAPSIERLEVHVKAPDSADFLRRLGMGPPPPDLEEAARVYLQYLVDALAEATLVDFDDREIEEFLVKWTASIEKAVGGETGVARAKAGDERRELLAAVRNNPGVRSLAANPLLLTILALMKRGGVGPLLCRNSGLPQALDRSPSQSNLSSLHNNRSARRGTGALCQIVPTLRQTAGSLRHRSLTLRHGSPASR